ncbi:hypothetical protein FOL47_007998 [Perkinsus chesapeaki]|uniref:subtilisin n=1 Tax=Perkinsus chesapeaki TaxID=330153 RepID=A0A7J6LGI0_PERCH|nr:hypothetical protein FOL47_007998 [Perkinsus chesapeaki]
MISFALVLLFAGLFASILTNRTLVMVKYGGKALDSRHLPNMMARALGQSRRLSDEDRIYENCLVNGDMIEDLSAIGVQIVKSSCPATTAQIASYMKKAHDALNVVSFVEPDSEVFLHTTPVVSSPHRAQSNREPNGLCVNDPLSSSQPNLELIRTVPAWRHIKGLNSIKPLKEVIVAVLDTGIDPNHPDLVNQMWRNPKDGSFGYNFYANNSDATDDNGRGTRVAGVIAAQTNNAVGIASIAEPGGVQIMSLEILSANARGNWSDTISALNFAIVNGALISTNSYISFSNSDIREQAIANAAARGHIFVASAGNDGAPLDTRPIHPCCSAVNIPSMLCVASTSSDPNHAVTLDPQSNYGSAVNIAAPGIDILSTSPGGYATRSGTSMATPHVAAVAALLASMGVEGQKITNAIVQYGANVSNSDIPLLDAARAILNA